MKCWCFDSQVLLKKTLPHFPMIPNALPYGSKLHPKKWRCTWPKSRAASWVSWVPCFSRLEKYLVISREILPEAPRKRAGSGAVGIWWVSWPSIWIRSWTIDYFNHEIYIPIKSQYIPIWFHEIHNKSLLIYGWLVVSAILKNMSLSMGRIIPYIMDNKIHVPNHQSE